MLDKNRKTNEVKAHCQGGSVGGSPSNQSRKQPLFSSSPANPAGAATVHDGYPLLSRGPGPRNEERWVQVNLGSQSKQRPRKAGWWWEDKEKEKDCLGLRVKYASCPHWLVSPKPHHLFLKSRTELPPPLLSAYSSPRPFSYCWPIRPVWI